MYCVRCGKWFEGTQDLCPDCAAGQAAPTETPAHAAPEAPAYAAPVEPAYTPAPSAEDTFRIQSPTLPPKKNGKKIALICVFAAVAVIALLAVVFWNQITGLFHKDFDTPAQHLQHIEEQSLNDSIDTLTDAYDQYLTMGEASGTSSAAEIHLLLGDDLLELLEMSLTQEGLPMELDWLSDILITGTVNSQNNAFQALIGIGLGNTTLLTVDAVADVAGDKMWLGFPELSGDYLCFDDLEEITGMSLEDLMASTRMAAQELTAAMPDAETLNSLLKKYSALVTDCIRDVSQSTQTVTQGEFSQEFTVFTAKVYAGDLLDLGEKLMTALKNDDQALDMLVNLAALEGGTTKAALRAELLASIDRILADIAAEKNAPSVDENDFILITTFVDGSDRICGRTLTMHDGDYEEQLLHYVTVYSDDRFSLEAVISDLTVSGTGSSGDLLSGEFTLRDDSGELCVIRLTDVGENGGKIRLQPSKAVLEEALREMDVAGGSILSGMNLVLELDVSSNGAAQDSKLQLLLNEQMLLGLTVSVQPTDAGQVRLPADGVDVMDDDASLQWVRGLDFSALTRNMTAAGVPKDLVDAVDYVLSALKASLRNY